jgi:hypothetical protein
MMRIAKTRFSFVRKYLGISNARALRKQRAALQESPADPEIIWVRLVTGKQHRMTAVPQPE